MIRSPLVLRVQYYRRMMEFWFEFASTYSHVAAQRIEAVAALRACRSVREGRVHVEGAPTFLIGNELYWGNDRLEDALAYCAGVRSS